MACFTIENLSFSYPEQTAKALDQVSMTVEEGEILLLCGVSGCGKSTLLRHLKTALTPHGTRSGRILMDGKPLQSYSEREQAGRIGYVLQHPDDQIVTDKVWHELAFGLENLGVDQQTMRLRIAEMASYFGIQDWFYRDVRTLSGGQKQLLNLAAVMAMNPDVLILDEPTSQLDPIAAADFLATLKKLNRELGITMVLSEHRLEEAMPMADRAAVLEGGRLTFLGTPAQTAQALCRQGSTLFAAMPTAARIFGAIGMEGTFPLTVRDGRALLQRLDPQPRQLPASPAPARSGGDKPLLSLKECWFRYERNGEDVLRGVSLALYPGEIFGIVGGNGTGKSTTLGVISGQRVPYRGKIRVRGKVVRPGFSARQMGIGALCQDPRATFVRDTVEADLRDLLQTLELPEQSKEERLRWAVETMALEPYLQRHPFDLSGGEQQRAAIAKVLLLQPEILLLDEPTKGMDAGFKEKFGAMLRAMRDQGMSIVLVSHDVEFCAAYADRCGLFFDGGLTAQNRPREFFAGNHFYTTTANRMARRWFPNAILPEEVAELCCKRS